MPTASSPPTEREPAGALDGRRALDGVDDLHLLRLMCQITDYQGGAAVGDDASVLGVGGAGRAPGLEPRVQPGAGRA
jgi:hypothetical protein